MVKVLLIPLAILAFLVFLIILGAIGHGDRLRDPRHVGKDLAPDQQEWIAAALLTTSKARPGMRLS